LITFIAAPSSNLVIEDSAQDFHSPLFLLCLKILNLLFINKLSCIEKDPASVSCGLDTYDRSGSLMILFVPERKLKMRKKIGECGT